MTLPGPPGRPLEQLLAAAEAADWSVQLREQVYESGVNPTRVDLRYGTTMRRLLLYSWYATHEGKGRKNDNYRTQSTRAHDGPFMSESGRLTIGVGWDLHSDVFVAFDGWTKRQTGKSSAVHVKAALLDAAAADGWAEATPYWDPRVAFTSSRFADFLEWAHRIADQRTSWLEPLDYSVSEDGDEATVVGDVWGAKPAPFLRVGDVLFLINERKELIEKSLWQVAAITPRKVQTGSGRYNRTNLVFECARVGTINDQAALERLLR